MCVYIYIHIYLCINFSRYIYIYIRLIFVRMLCHLPGLCNRVLAYISTHIPTIHICIYIQKSLNNYIPT